MQGVRETSFGYLLIRRTNFSRVGYLSYLVLGRRIDGSGPRDPLNVHRKPLTWPPGLQTPQPKWVPFINKYFCQILSPPFPRLVLSKFPPSLFPNLGKSIVRWRLCVAHLEGPIFLVVGCILSKIYNVPKTKAKHKGKRVYIHLWYTLVICKRHFLYCVTLLQYFDKSVSQKCHFMIMKMYQF